jgi:prepilin-type processing-associated H-X9-DG protein
MGVALQLHHDALQALPVGCSKCTSNKIGWSVYVLPFLEEETLRDQFDTKKKFSDPANRAVAGTILPVYLCPSTTRLAVGRDGMTVGDKNRNGVYDPGDWAAAIDYGGNYGASLVTPPDNGVLIYERAVKYKEILDGTSHTIAVSEDSGRGWLWDGEWANGGNVFDQIGQVNQQQNNEMWSDHREGVHVLFCDGSVTMIVNATAADVLRALCTRAQGDLDLELTE